MRLLLAVCTTLVVLLHAFAPALHRLQHHAAAADDDATFVCSCGHHTAPAPVRDDGQPRLRPGSSLSEQCAFCVELARGQHWTSMATPVLLRAGFAVVALPAVPRAPPRAWSPCTQALPRAPPRS